MGEVLVLQAVVWNEKTRPTAGAESRAVENVFKSPNFRFLRTF